VQAMGLSGISKSQVSKLCKEIDERVHTLLDSSRLTKAQMTTQPITPH
jgi:transposase-like protein